MLAVFSAAVAADAQAAHGCPARHAEHAQRFVGMIRTRKRATSAHGRQPGLALGDRLHRRVLVSGARRLLAAADDVDAAVMLLVASVAVERDALFANQRRDLRRRCCRRRPPAADRRLVVLTTLALYRQAPGLAIPVDDCLERTIARQNGQQSRGR